MCRIIVYLKDIMEAIERIEEYAEGMDFEDFMQNKLVQDAVLRRLEIIGEAVKNIPKEFREKYGKGFARTKGKD